MFLTIEEWGDILVAIKMKLHKQIILLVVVYLNIDASLTLMQQLSIAIAPLLLAIIAGRLIFTWKWASGRFPEIRFLHAYIVTLFFVGAVTLVTAFYIHSIVPCALSDVFLYWWEYLPSIYYGPLASSFVSLHLWRWVFKKEREEIEGRYSVLF